MKFVRIAGYRLKELTRDIRDLLTPLVFPLVFTLVFGFVFRGITGPGGQPYFDYLVPGMVVFALLLVTTGVSGSLAREVERGTLATWTLVAAFAKSEGQSSSLSTLVAVPLAFLVGVFFQTRTEAIARILPWGQAASALRGILNFGAPVREVWANIGVMVGQTIILFGIGVFAFSRVRLE